MTRAGRSLLAIPVAMLALAGCATSITGTGTTARTAASGTTQSPSPSRDDDSDTSGTPSVSAAPGLPGRNAPPVVIGTKDFAEQILLGNLYAKALAAKGYRVALKQSVGPTDIVDAALTAGKIDMYPEYTGVIYTTLARRTDHPTSAAAVLQVAVAYERAHGVTVEQPTPFEDADGIAVTRAYAAKHGIRSVADLAKVGAFTYGAASQYRTLYQGVAGLRKVYGLKRLVFKTVPFGAQYTALDRGQVDTASVFTTDPQLGGGKYNVLSDPRHLFGFQQVVPVANAHKLAQFGPAFATTVNAVSALLTQSNVIVLNRAVQIDRDAPAAVATAFLRAHHLA